jgi:hypothetical protein
MTTETRQAHLDNPMGELQHSKYRNRRDYKARVTFVSILAILLFGIAIMSVAHARAQSRRLPSRAVIDAGSLQNGSTMRVDDDLRWLGCSLSLSPEQKEEIRPVVEEELRERTAFLETTSPSTLEQEAQLVDLRNHALEEIQAVLTGPQRVRLRELEKD